MRVVLALASAALMSWDTKALDIVDDGWSVHEEFTFGCTSYLGFRVRFYNDPNLDNVGVAQNIGTSNPIVILNLDEINDYVNYLPRVFWVFHECGHHALRPGQNGEVASDCWAAKKMEEVGLLFDYDYRDGAIYSKFFRDFRGLLASPEGHLDGHDRADLIEECMLYEY